MRFFSSSTAGVDNAWDFDISEVGIGCHVLEPRLGDFNDDLRANGKDALRQHLAGQIGPEDRHRLLG